MTPRDCILVEELRVDALVGLLPWEKQVRQPLLFDLKLYLPLKEVAESGELSRGVDYAEVTRLLEAMLENHVELIETVAEEACRRLFEAFDALQAIEITVRKPAILPQTHSVGVRLWRKRS